MSNNYQGLRRVDEPQRTSERLLALREGSLKTITDQRDDDSFLLATWNLRDFDSNKFGFGPRLEESFYYIAEVISCFDLVAIQEVNNDIRPFMKLMRILGSNEWDYLLTDTTAGTSGNQERMAFVFRRSKVWFRKIAGEIVLPNGQLIVEPTKVDPRKTADGTAASGSVEHQFARSPYLVAFQAGWFKFSLCTVHIYYGDETGAKLTRRINEIEALVKFFATRQNKEVAAAKKESEAQQANMPKERTPPPQVENYILLGDFNVVSPEHETMQALKSKGFKVPRQIDAEHIPEGDRPHFYDQIAVRVKDKRFSVVSGGVLDIYADVFRDEDEPVYRTWVPERDKETGAPKARTPQQRYEKWRTWQMSDHYPLWVKIDSDFADDYLRTIADGQ
jgi:hypothetical protein